LPSQSALMYLVRLLNSFIPRRRPAYRPSNPAPKRTATTSNNTKLEETRQTRIESFDSAGEDTERQAGRTRAWSWTNREGEAIKKPDFDPFLFAASLAFCKSMSAHLDRINRRDPEAVVSLFDERKYASVNPKRVRLTAHNLEYFMSKCMESFDYSNNLVLYSLVLFQRLVSVNALTEQQMPNAYSWRLALLCCIFVAQNLVPTPLQADSELSNHASYMDYADMMQVWSSATVFKTFTWEQPVLKDMVAAIVNALGGVGNVQVSKQHRDAFLELIVAAWTLEFETEFSMPSEPRVKVPASPRRTNRASLKLA
jgi:hypothetical protein